MLNDKDLASLMNKLEVPVAVCAAVDHGQKLQDDIHYALHDLLADMQPDAVLLAIAMSAKSIAVRYCGSNSGTEILTMECDRIVKEYGSLWLENRRRPRSDNAYMISILETIAEDLEGLSEMIELHLSYAAYDNKAAGEICESLRSQADAHAIIAEEFLAVMDMAAQQKSKHNPSFPHNLMAANASGEIETGKVIRFPG